MDHLFGGHFSDQLTRKTKPPTDPHDGGSVYSGFMSQPLARQHTVLAKPSPQNFAAFCSPVRTRITPDQGFHQTRHVREEENYDQSMTDPYPSMIYLSQIMSEPSQGTPTSNQGIPASNQGTPAPNQGIPASTQDIPALTQGIPTLTQGLQAPTQCIPAPTQGIPASTQGIPASTQSIPALIQCIRAPIQCIPARTQGIPPPIQCIPARPQGIPPPIQCIPASNQGITALNQGIPAATQGIPTPTEGIHVPTQCIPACTQFIPAPIQVIPASNQGKPAPTQFIPPPTQCIPAPTQGIPASTQSIPPPIQCIQAPIQCIQLTQGIPPTIQCLPASTQGIQTLTQDKQKHPHDLTHQRFHSSTRSVRHEFGPSIRQDIHNSIRSSITKFGTITQVCGPPMVGKSTSIDQAIQELQESQTNSQHDGFQYHLFLCKRLATLQDILATVMATIQQGRTFTASSNTYTEAFVLSQIQSLLLRCEKYHHIFVFHKCESLRTSGRDHEFLAFLIKLSKFWWSAGFMVSVVFTTYKKFPIAGSNPGHVEVDMLTDPIDIKALLEHHAPGVDVTGYIKICQKFLCFPEAVVRLAEEYLVNDKTRSSPEHLEKRVCLDADFQSLIFDKRVADVEGWLQQCDLELLMYFGSSVDSTFTKENFIEVLKKQIDVYRFDQWVQSLLKRLKDNYVFRTVYDSGNRLAVHPLLVYYSKIAKTQGTLAIKDQSCSSFTVFVSHVLKTAEKDILLHGKKGQVYGCLAQEWPHVRHVLELAINCTSGTYEAFLKVAVHGRRLVMSCFPNESKDFYKSLFINAKDYGSPQQQAVLEACLGHITASGTGIDWKLSEKYLDSAIETLKSVGPVHYYKWALASKANILQRQGNNPKSMKYFMKIKEVSDFDIPGEVDGILKISEQQKGQEKLTTEILETVPMIFLGDNERAREKLYILLNELDSRCPNHPELSILLNNIGLTFERGNKDLKGALEWYQKAYIQKCYLEKICPQDLVVLLNNIGMCYGRLNQLDRGKRYLEKALEIQLERSVIHYDTALTLAHIAELIINQQNFFEAYEKSLKAEKILKKIAKQHDFRLRVLNSLVHYRIIIRQLNLMTAKTKNSLFVKSAEDFIDKMLKLGRKIHLTDEGHHDMMTAYEHGMILNWGNSREKFHEYKSRYLLHVTQNDYIRDMIFTKKDELASVAKHKSLYFYISDTEYEDLDLKTFIHYMIPTCPYCQEINHVYRANMWHDEVRYLIHQRQQK